MLLCSSFSTWKSGVSCLSPQCRGPDVIMVRWLRKLDRSTFRTYSALLSHSRSAFVLFWYVSKSKIQSSDAVRLILHCIKGKTDGRDHDVCGKSLLFQSDTKTSCYTLNFLFSLCSLTSINLSFSISFWQPFVADVSDSDHFYSKRDRKKIQNQNYNCELHVGGRIHILYLTKST